MSFVKRTSWEAEGGREKKGQNQLPPSFCSYSQIDFLGPGATLHFVCVLCVCFLLPLVCLLIHQCWHWGEKACTFGARKHLLAHLCPLILRTAMLVRLQAPQSLAFWKFPKSGIGDLEDIEAKSAGSLHAGQPKSLAESPWFSAGGSEACAEGEVLLGRWRGINPLCRHHLPSLNYECPLSLNVCQLFKKQNCEYKLQSSWGPQYFSIVADVS